MAASGELKWYDGNVGHLSRSRRRRRLRRQSDDSQPASSIGE